MIYKSTWYKESRKLKRLRGQSYISKLGKKVNEKIFFLIIKCCKKRAEEKTATITEMEPLENKKELQRFLGIQSIKGNSKRLQGNTYTQKCIEKQYPLHMN